MLWYIGIIRQTVESIKYSRTTFVGKLLVFGKVIFAYAYRKFKVVFITLTKTCHPEELRMRKSYNHVHGILFLCILLLAGCASFTEGIKGFIGMSTKALEEGKGEAIKLKPINCDYATAYRKIKSALKKNGDYIYAQDAKKGMIAIYLSSSKDKNTTPVGVFLVKINDTTTQIEITSQSPYAKELIADQVSLAFQDLK